MGQQLIHGNALAETQGEDRAGVVALAVGVAGDLHILKGDLIFQQEYLIINISGDYAGKPMQNSGVYALMERLQKKTGIKVTPHMLRHYFANARRKAGWKLELISQALGHRNIETTMRYLNISDQELMDVSDEFYRKHQSIYEIDKLL